ncbi:MAG: EthD family reductase, partial [Acidimicrobiia bacterium]|nr:EthD family reductase [Acidimicrobiia bacterium]
MNAPTPPSAPWPTTEGVLALCSDAEAAAAAAERVLASGQATGVVLNQAVAGHTGPFVGMVRAVGDADLLAPLVADAADTGLYRAQFRRVRDMARDWPDGATTPGITATFAMVRRADLTHDAADGHWRDTHAPLALKHHVGMWGYTQCSIVEALTGSSAAYDGVALCQFATLEDFKERFFDGPEGVEAIRADVAKFSDVKASPSLRTV